MTLSFKKSKDSRGKKVLKLKNTFIIYQIPAHKINIKIAVSLVYANNGFDEKEIRIIFSFTTASTISGSKYN